MNNQELLPCPFCSGEAILEDCISYITAFCSNCGSNNDVHASTDDCISTWNTRADHADVNKKVWVSFEERLPEEDATVLVTDGKRQTVEQATSYVLNCIRESENYYFSTLTHWMPLPAPPK